MLNNHVQGGIIDSTQQTGWNGLLLLYHSQVDEYTLALLKLEYSKTTNNAWKILYLIVVLYAYVHFYHEKWYYSYKNYKKKPALRE